MSTLPFAGPFDDLLIPFDPGRCLDHWWEHLELYAAADPKVAAARNLMERRLGSLTDADVEALAALFWGALRRGLQAGSRPSRFRVWLADGDQVLAAVQRALDFLLTPAVLSTLAEQARDLEGQDSPGATDLNIAKTEVHGFVAADFGPATVLALAAGVGIVVIADTIESAIHGHEGWAYHGPHV